MAMDTGNTSRAGSAGAQKAEVELSYTVEGADRSGTPTVFLHGVGSRSEVWRRVLELMDHHGPVVTYDLRGHGTSGRPPGPYHLDDFAADHLRLLDRLGIERANVVGFSLGGLIAQAIAIARPDTVEKLAILSAVAGRTDAERAAVRQRLATVEREGPRGVAAQGPDRWYTRRFQQRSPEAVARHLERFLANDPAAYAAAFRVLAENDLADRLTEIKAPTLVMTGADDVGSPPHMARLMAERISDSELVIVEDVKHGILEELPQRVAAELSSFLSPARRPGDATSGMSARRAVLGTDYVARATSNDDPLSLEFQDFVTNYCWGVIWTDDRLSRREHSLLTLAMTAALGRMDEFEAHARGALRNGVTPEQFAAIAKQIAVYCGVPAGVNASKALRKALESQPGAWQASADRTDATHVG